MEVSTVYILIKTKISESNSITNCVQRCNKKVVSYTSLKTGLLNSDAVDLVLTEGTEIFKENYWLSENNKKGKNARHVLDLGCDKEINGLYIRNTHNSFKHNRGTKGFTLFKTNTADGPSAVLVLGRFEKWSS